MHLPGQIVHLRIARVVAWIAAAVAVLLLLTPTSAYANVALTRVSTDPYTDAQAQHRTEVEPDTFAFGNTIVSAFQGGRLFDGGGRLLHAGKPFLDSMQMHIS